MEISDHWAVLRDGVSVGEGDTPTATTDQLIALMVGRAVADLYPRSSRTAGEVVLEVRDLAGVAKPVSASLSLRRGEVVGLAGLVGAGRTEFLRALFGLEPVRHGAIRVEAYVGPASPARRWQQNVGFLSEDRKVEGLALSLSLADNMTLSKLVNLGPGGLVLPSRQNTTAQRWIDRLGIRCHGPQQAVGQLSGGNQQKVAIARLLQHDVDIFLLDEPTRGIDVGSKAQIYQIIDELATKGKAILMVSSYLPELLGVCDRVAVMCRGRVGEARPVAEFDQHTIMQEATGSA